jgi:SAM-dependent methyltransferase
MALDFCRDLSYITPTCSGENNSRQNLSAILKLQANQSYFADQAVAFYDRIAASYDQLIEAYSTNARLRQAVAEYFKKTVPAGADVMDFGGGTGLDLPWLVEAGFFVYFCEPSQGMGEIAIRRIQFLNASAKVKFLDSSQLNWLGWLDPGAAPPCNVQAALANLAVFNCLAAPEAAFAALAAALKPAGHLIISVIDSTLTRLMLSPKRWRSFLAARRRGEDPRLYPRAGNHRQIAYLHSLPRLKNAAQWWFELFHQKRMSRYGYVLLDFIRRPL